jgi:hypothetical protein
MLEVDGEGLPIAVAGYQAVTVGGFTSAAIHAMDVTDPLKVREVMGTIAAEEGGYAITVAAPESGTRDLLVYEEGQVRAAEVTSNYPSVWNWKTSGSDVVIIAHGDFIVKLWALKLQQEAEGHRVALANVEDIYDEFSYGEKSPYALKDFLEKAWADWSMKPRYLVLAGDASFDPRNYLGLGDFDYVPTKLIDTALMETASDDWYGDFDGDGIAEIAVGRLPVRTTEEAGRQVEKILGYRQGIGQAGSWADEVVLVADSNDGFDFEGASEELAAEVRGTMAVSRIYRGQMDDASARAQVWGSLNAGALLVNYLGHGSVEVWRGDLLTSAGAAGLMNGTKLPFVIAMNCLNGYFDDIYTESLAESLMKAPNGGAIGVWASSGLTDAVYQKPMNLEIFRQLFGYDQTLGEAILKAKASTSDPDVRRTWILFGDPAMKLRH